jgi:aspartyl-tRNA(Asn)/glutamyl-tRNA(Gln) amidotransferase subunit A
LIAVKDNISTKDSPTTCASSVLKTYTSPNDATVIRLLRKEGASIIGKTNMDEFGMGSHSTHSAFGSVVNIQDDQAYSAGGSSGGSAVAVAEGTCWAALGTDTGGSVRLPAAYSGTVGFKPSYGLVSRWGVVAYANSLDTVGILAKDTESVKKVFETVSKYDARDPTSLSEAVRENIKKQEHNGPLTIGIPVDFNIKELDITIRKAWIDSLNALQKLGHKLVPVQIPTFQLALSAYYILAPAEASSNLARYDGIRYGTPIEGSDGQGSTLYSATRDSGFGEEVKRRILLGSYTLSAEAMDSHFMQAQRVRRLLQQDLNTIFRQSHPLLNETPVDTESGVDVLIAPTAPNLPPLLAEVANLTPIQNYMMDVFTVPASLAGLPAISVPVGPAKIGMQIMGQFGSDSLVLSLSKELMT